MADNKKENTSSNWSAVSQVYHNLPVIWCFLITWSKINEHFTPDGLINLYRVCWGIAWLLQNNKMKVKVLFSVGEVYIRIRRFNDALECFNKVLGIEETTGNKHSQGIAYLRIGNVHLTLGNKKEALEYYVKALQIFRQTGELTSEGETLNNIGNVHLSRGEYGEALRYYKDFLTICRQTCNIAREGQAMTIIGNVHQSRGEYEEALKYYKDAFKIHRQTGDLTGEGNALGGIGNVHLARGEYEEALKYYKDDLKIYRQTGGLAEEGATLNNIGIVYHSRGEYEKALKYYRETLEIQRQVGDLAEEGKTLNNIGTVHRSRGEYTEALKYYRDYLKISRQTGDLAGEGNMLCNIGTVHQSRGQYEEALKYYKEALKIQRQTGDLVGERNTLNYIGGVHHSRGENKEALKHYKDALKITRQTGDLAGEGKSLNNIGIVHRSRGEYEEAMKYYEDALKIQRQTGDLAGDVQTLNHIGVVHQSRGEYKEALTYYKDALTMTRQAGNLAGEGNTLNNIGIVHESRGEYEEALKHYKNASKIQRKIGDLTSEGNTLANICNVHRSRGEYGEALKYCKEALKIQRQTGDLAGEGSTLSNLASVHQSRGEYEEALKYYKDALKIKRQTGDLAGEAATSSNLGGLLVFTGDISEAENQLKKSISCYEKIFSMLGNQCPSKVTIGDIYIKTYRVLTIVLIIRGKCQEALLASESGRSQALREHLFDKYKLTSEQAIPSARAKDFNLVITSSRNSVFVTYYDSLLAGLLTFLMSVSQKITARLLFPSDLIQLLHKEHDKEMQNVLFSCVNKLIQYADEYLRRNLDSTFEDRSLGQAEQKVTLYEQTRGDTVVPIEKIKELLSARRESTKQSEGEQAEKGVSSKQDDQPANKDQNATTSGMNESSSESGHKTDSNTTRLEDKSCEDLLKDFFKALIAPIESELDQPEIVIIPDGPLFFVPFAALQDSKGRYLSETKRIRIGSSLSTLQILKEYPAKKQSTKGALIIGDPLVENVMRYGEFEEKPFQDLPNACDEALRVAALLREKPLIRGAANKQTVMSRLREGVAVMHFSTHGSGQTGELLLAPGPRDDHTVPTEENYMLTVKEITSCNINAQLVVLSCCYGGSGEVRAEGVMSLARAFLVAGARSVLATLWQVSDQGTLHFMNSFYRHLTSGKSACASQQEAMREMRAHPEYNHWSYWAPFFIIGHDVTLFGGSDVTGITVMYNTTRKRKLTQGHTIVEKS